MKKYVAFIISAVLLGGLLSGCGSKAETETTDSGTGETDITETAATPTYLKDIEVDKSVTLGEYKGLEISLAPVAVVTDADVDASVTQIMAENPMPTTEAAKAGDQVTFDFVGKLDGVEFEGGSGTDTTLVIGSNYFIPELEQGMIGMTAGEVKDVPATFPDPYEGNPELSGKEAVFTITMDSVMSVQENVDDAYVSWLTADEYTNVTDFRAYVRENLELDAQTRYDTEVTGLLSDAVVAGCEFKEMPQGLVERLTVSLTNTFTYYASLYGMDMNTYLVYSGMVGTDEDPAAALAVQAEDSAKRYLAYQAIANSENLNVTDSQMEEELAEMAASAGTTVEEYETNIDKESYREYLMLEGVSEFVKENAVITESATAE